MWDGKVRVNRGCVDNNLAHISICKYYQGLYSITGLNMPRTRTNVLTTRQSEVLRFIRESIDDSGMPPTRREITDHFNWGSLNAAEEHLKALERKGVIIVTRKKSRGIQLAGDGSMRRGASIPIIGRVAAGSPIDAIEHVETHVTIPVNMFSPAADYFLRVRGDSMVNIGVYDDDLVAVHRTQTVANGQIVVARIGDEVTLKRFERIQNSPQVRLIAENDNIAAIEVDTKKEDFVIEGVSVGVVRQSM